MTRKPTKQGRNIAKLAAIIFGLVVITFGIGYVFAVRVLFPPLPEPKNGIVVPKLAGLDVAQAEALLRKAGLRVTDVVEIATTSQPAGLIVAQSPLPGQQLRTAGAVQLGVSSGPPPAPAPGPAPTPVPAPTTAPAPADSPAPTTTPAPAPVGPDTARRDSVSRRTT